MSRALFLLFCLPMPAFAEWLPLPRAFPYDASFERCINDPTRVDVIECADILRRAYDLNTAVVRAVNTCDTVSVRDCPVAFEDQGLPAITARIAADSGCDETALTEFAPFTHLPANHCITMITDILRDEGVVPLIESMPCAPRDQDCQGLRDIHAGLWDDAVTRLSDTDLTRLRKDENWNDCFDQSEREDVLMECYTAALAYIWAELALQDKQDN